MKMQKTTSKFILQNKESDKEKGALFMAIDFPHSHKRKVMDFEAIFPLQKIKFENKEFLAPNDPQKILETEFGDYMKIPKDTYPRHTSYNSMTEQEKEILESFTK